MVLAIRLISIFACLTSPLMAEVFDTAEVGDQTVTLRQEGYKCVLAAGDDLFATGLPAPCAFARRQADGPPIAHQYADIGDVLLIVGPEAHRQDYETNDAVKTSHKCSHVGQAVILSSSDVKMSEVMVEPLGFCANLAPDEKFYYGIAHHK